MSSETIIEGLKPWEWLVKNNDLICAIVAKLRHVSRTFYRQTEMLGGFDDAVSESRIIFLRKCHKYDQKRGAVSTWLGYWLRSEMARIAGIRSLVHKPGHWWGKDDPRRCRGRIDCHDAQQSPLFLYLLDKTDKTPDLSRVYSAISHLRQRDKEIVEAYYFCDETYRQIAKRYGISSERVRQILKSAYEELRWILENSEK
jgi:RNA polymerase sigma factor (sigma-70 family)